MFILKECNHGRTNETRDRLRKRLNQIHSKTHSTKTIKTPPGALKKMLATRVVASSSSLEVELTQKTHKPAEQKENHTNELLEAAFSENFLPREKFSITETKEKVCLKKIITTTSTESTSVNIITTPIDPKNAKKRKVLRQEDEHHAVDCAPGLCKTCDAKPKVKAKPPPSASEVPKERLPAVAQTVSELLPPTDRDLDDLIDFIEGNTSNKKDSQKKAAKKAKQKQKKEDFKRIEELEQLRNQFHDTFFKELNVKGELKQQRCMKKRDKKKIGELEMSLKKYGKYKSKIEANILELITAVKENNSEFKFAYLPTKEQLLEKQHQEQKHHQPHQQSQSDSQTLSVSVEQLRNDQPERSNNLRIIQNDQNSECEIALEQSKRMVTIRRITTGPHAEPQVTVTAKGTSPDKDKLLYTFINGQLIPNTNVTASSHATVIVNPNMQLLQQKLNDKIDRPDKIAGKAKTNPKPADANSNKKAIEVSKKIAEPNVIEKSDKKTTKEKASDKNRCADKATNIRKMSPETVKSSATATNANNGKVIKTTSNINSTPVTAKEKDKQKNRAKKSAESDIESITSSAKDLSLAEEKPKKEKKKLKAVKYEYADPNYKINQFNLLDMDEDDDYYIESSDESSDDESSTESPTLQKPDKIEMPKVKAATPVDAPPVQTNNKSTNNDIAAAANKLPKATKNAQPATTKKGKPESNKCDIKTLPDSSAAIPNKTSIAQNTTNVTNCVDANLTKKQKKKLQKEQLQHQPQQQQPQPQQRQQQSQPQLVRSKASIERAANVDNSVQSINNAMQRMHLNSEANTGRNIDVSTLVQSSFP